MPGGNRNSESSERGALGVTIVDYGMGNVRSVQSAFERLGCAASISSEASAFRHADALVLPGVGAFGQAMDNLRSSGLLAALEGEVRDQRKPILGICLGMQLFATTSEELGTHAGLDWIPGRVRAIDPTGAKLPVPHVGWNDVRPRGAEGLFTKVAPGANFYFDHSYYFDCADEYVTASVDYGVPLAAAVRRDWIMGVQFHPEKSDVAGLKLLRAFLDFATRRRAEAA